ncbi:MAG: 4-hydroxy-tetrahydrodipicolinate synthase [Anaerovoracaceae bacterium]|nr:4-hydroxy-tetrahydrodipicolinate synthase [Anaerovoracaceae bacterium]
MAIFTGTATALVTPFRGGKIDYVTLGKLVEWQIKEGVDALVVCGTTGEASTLSGKERVQLTRFVADLVKGRVPVLAGTGSNNTRFTLDLSREIEAAGADGILVVTPYYNKCTEIGMIAHYEKIADSVSIPMILYSVPSRTGVNIPPSVVEVLSRHPGIAGIKEASGNMGQVCAMAQYICDDFQIYAGNDDLTIPFLSLGGAGCISTVSNLIPGRFSSMIRSWLSGDTAGAAAEQIAMKPLIDAIFTEVNPVPLKAAMSMMGLCEMEYRLPLCPPTNKTQYLLYDTLKKNGLVE